MLLTVLAFIATIVVLVLVHEFGHFFAARWFKVRVDEFGFGFPPRIASYRSRRGATRFSLNWIPLGGFVKIKGEQGEDVDDPDSFSGRPRYQRAVILAAGILMNFVLAAGLLGIGFSVGLPTVVDESLPPTAIVRDVNIRVADVVADSPAALAGVKAGDAIIAVDGQPVASIPNLQAYTNDHTGQGISLTIDREGMPLTLAVTPRSLDASGRGLLGVGLFQTGLVRYPVPIAVLRGIEGTVDVTRQIVTTLGTVLKNLVTTGHADTELTGPVGIAVLTGQVSRLGTIYLLQFVALLSINLAIINALPIPALDGGRLLFLGIEAVRRRAVDRRIESRVHTVGFALLILLMLVVTYRDIVRFGGQILNVVRRAVGGS